jgi:hypothetical protein
MQAFLGDEAVSKAEWTHPADPGSPSQGAAMINLELSFDLPA